MQQDKILKVFVSALLLASNIATHAQLFTPLGLGVDKCESLGINTFQRMHIEDDILYVCTSQGIYSKSLSQLDSSWQLEGFDAVPVQDYVRKGDDIIALIKRTDGKYLLLSHDGGKTYEDITPDSFRKEQFLKHLVQHPTDPNTLLVSGSMGLFQSSDFGQTWKKLINNSYSTSIGYHRSNPDIIYECGTGSFYQPYIFISYDGGQTWRYIEPGMGDNHVGSIAFNPTDPDVWIAGGAMGKVFISTDNGNTWENVLLNRKESELFEASWVYTVYDNVNSDIIYMAGCGYGNEVMCSTDGGKTWNIPHTLPQKMRNEGVYDFKQYDDKLLIYAESDVYAISKSGLVEENSTPVYEPLFSLDGIDVVSFSYDDSEKLFYFFTPDTLMYKVNMDSGIISSDSSDIFYGCTVNDDFCYYYRNDPGLTIINQEKDTVASTSVYFIRDYYRYIGWYENDFYYYRGDIRSSEGNDAIHRYSDDSNVLFCVEVYGFTIGGDNIYVLQGKTKSGREARISEYSLVSGVKKEISGLDGLNSPIGISYSKEGCLYVFSDADNTLYRIPLEDDNTVDTPEIKVESMQSSFNEFHYGTDGRLISPDAPGFHIVRMPDGRMRKALILSK